LPWQSGAPVLKDMKPDWATDIQLETNGVASVDGTQEHGMTQERRIIFKALKTS